MESSRGGVSKSEEAKRIYGWSRNKKAVRKREKILKEGMESYPQHCSMINT
jgi:hypothetical protein